MLLVLKFTSFSLTNSRAAVFPYCAIARSNHRRDRPGLKQEPARHYSMRELGLAMEFDLIMNIASAVMVAAVPRAGSSCHGEARFIILNNLR